MSLQLTLLGTGTPHPLAHRAGSSYLVHLEDRMILIDCGPGSFSRLLQKGVSPLAVSHLLLTHLHYDHCADYAPFELTRWDQAAGKVPELAVIGPEGTRRMTRLLFAEDGVFAADLSARTNHPASRQVFESRGGRGARRRPKPAVFEIGDSTIFAESDWRLRAAQVVHCEPQLVTLAYRLETAYGTIVFGADTAPTPALTKLAEGADVLVHMCHFLNNSEVDSRALGSCSGHLDAATTARDAGVGRLVLTHITPGLEEAGVRERILTEASQVFPGTIIFGEDLLEIPIESASASAATNAI